MIWELVVPHLSQKVAIFANLGQDLSQKVGFSYFLSQFYELAAVVFSQFFPNII